MIHLALRTEFSFRQCFLPIRDVHKYVSHGAVGIADHHSTFGHIPLMKEAKKHGFKPIYGVRLTTLPNGTDYRTNQRPWIYIARNNDGLREIYELNTLSFEKFRYLPRIEFSDVESLSNNVIVIATCDFNTDISGLAHYQAYGPGNDMCRSDLKPIFISQNNYGDPDDDLVYQVIAGTRPGENDPIFQFETRTDEQHIISFEKATALYPNNDAYINSQYVSESIDTNIEKAPPLVFGGTRTVRAECERGIKVRGLTLNDEYRARLDYELKLIDEKGFNDYFLIVSDMVLEAKKTMLVGPCRGSSAGSLVCYLLGITEIDPIKYDLIFERFIDINRFDMPDIDIDFPDTKRDNVVAYLTKRYGKNRVCHISNVNRYKTKSAIADFGKALYIPKADLEEFKGSIIERSGGDARVVTIADEFESETGKKFIEEYPMMRLAARVEHHATHVGKHAAGIIVSPVDLVTFGSINVREDSIQMDKRDAESIDLLKIDCLGLRTLSILEECCDQISMKYDSLYTLPLDCAKTYSLINSMRLQGIFQFEGQALAMLVRDIGVSKFDDLVAITALARPGALRSGGAAIFTACANGRAEPKYFGDLHYEITKDTYGVMVYQEQMMRIAREIAGFSWMVVSDMRKAASKSLGDDYFKKFEDDFIKGCMETGKLNLTDATLLWKDVSHSGSWIFNKSHAVAYATISYWTAFFKAHYPLEFAIANLNNVSDDESALKMLRDMVTVDKLKYIPVDPDKSAVKWTVQDGVLVGGLTNIEGIAEKTAEKVILARKGKARLTPSILKKLLEPKTTFDILFPTEHYWGRLIGDPKSFGLDSRISSLREVQGEGDYIVIGKLKKRNLMDLNEYNKVLKRGHELPEENRWYLNLIIEDDTDSLMCHVDRYDFQRLNGRYLAEHGKVDEDWYLIKGSVNGNWRGLHVEEILNLKEHFGGYLL